MSDSSKPVKIFETPYCKVVVKGHFEECNTVEGHYFFKIFRDIFFTLVLTDEKAHAKIVANGATFDVVVTPGGMIVEYLDRSVELTWKNAS